MTHITLTKTESSRNGVAFFEGDQDIGYETAAIVASASPLGIMSMGTFPSSLIAWASSQTWDAAPGAFAQADQRTHGVRSADPPARQGKAASFEAP